MQVRVIGSSTTNGREEQVIFTRKLYADVDDFIPQDHSVNFDEICDRDLPNGFPFEYPLKRED